MIWHIELNWNRSELSSEGELSEVIKQADALPQFCLNLEKAHIKKRSRFEKILYKLLGLVIERDVPTGTIQASFSGGHAHVVFLKNDDDNGSIALTENDEIEKSTIEFALPNGETFSEQSTNCISRSQAFEAFLEFYKWKKRPAFLKWVAVKN